MPRSIALLLALALGCSAAAQACGTSSVKPTKPDISRPGQPPGNG